jgi:hypothetical protein
MSSISCWTSATRCLNSLVSHPTSNSYPSTFSWSIRRWRDSSPLSILSALHLSRLAFDQGFGQSVCCWVLGIARVGYVGEGLQPGQKKALRGRRHRAHKGRAKSRQRKLLPDCVLFIFPNLFTLIHSLACSAFGSLSYLYITHQTCAATFKRSSARHPITSK